MLKPPNVSKPLRPLTTGRPSSGPEDPVQLGRVRDEGIVPLPGEHADPAGARDDLVGAPGQLGRLLAELIVHRARSLRPSRTQHRHELPAERRRAPRVTGRLEPLEARLDDQVFAPVARVVDLDLIEHPRVEGVRGPDSRDRERVDGQREHDLRRIVGVEKHEHVREVRRRILVDEWSLTVIGAPHGVTPGQRDDDRQQHGDEHGATERQACHERFSAGKPMVTPPAGCTAMREESPTLDRRSRQVKTPMPPCWRYVKWPPVRTP